MGSLQGTRCRPEIATTACRRSRNGGGAAARSAAAERGGLGRARRRRMEGVFKVRGVCPRLPRPALRQAQDGLAMVCMCPLRGPPRRSVAVSERAERRRMGSLLGTRCLPGIATTAWRRSRNGGVVAPLRGPPRRTVAVSERARRRKHDASSLGEASVRDCHERLAPSANRPHPLGPLSVDGGGDGDSQGERSPPACSELPPPPLLGPPTLPCHRRYDFPTPLAILDP
jgi:hypothetical protein